MDRYYTAQKRAIIYVYLMSINTFKGMHFSKLKWKLRSIISLILFLGIAIVRLWRHKKRAFVPKQSPG